MRIYDDAEQDFRGSTTLTKWQGDESTLIDRFDVRNFLETIPKKSTSVEEGPKTAEEFIEQMQIEYERYKELVAVEFTGDDEERVLKNMEEKEQKKMLARLSKYRHKKQTKPAKKAAIGFTYDDDQEETQEKNEQDDSETKKASFSKPASDSESSEDEEELFSARLGSIIFSSNDWERLNKIGEKYHL
uniref:Suppressor of white apricot N-terminal domain-containing protein n=1 Tax=Panagrolaimus sp. JU765 TaxID=591449 RepID=A0AC34R0X6_9BILA